MSDDVETPWLFDDDTDGRPDPEDVRLGLALPDLRRRPRLNVLCTRPHWADR